MQRNTWRDSLIPKEEEEEDWEELVKKDMLKNPTLAVISDHLWWLALSVKLSIVIAILTIMSIW